MISKELFVEVMGKEMMYCVLNIDTGELDVEEFYNIHELAHKVKEWALSQGYSTFSYNDYDGSGFFAQVALENKPQPEKWSDGKTEPEAIFKAGQWILENR